VSAKVRSAELGDCAAIAAILLPIISQSIITFNSVVKSADDIVQMLADKARDGHAVFVAEDAGRVVGYATYGQFRSGIGYAQTMEHSIALAPEAAGKGLGRALMVAVEAHARAGGAHSMIAGVSAPNTAGHDFHAALGYVVLATLPQVGRKFDQWLDLIVMQKFL
jgi:L-amino acid N-acyltransferase YncA